MKNRLINIGLWKEEDFGNPETDITAAWRLLARLASSGRSLGRTPNGYYEYAIVNPASGCILSSAQGPTLPQAICAAVLLAKETQNGSSQH